MGDAAYDGGNLEGLPSAYAAWRASTLGRITDALEQELVLDLIGPVAGMHILDVGCGDGVLAAELARRGAVVTGIDSSSRMIAAARRRAREHGVDVTFYVATAQELPFAPDAFDTVVAVTALCFVADAAPVLGEMTRVLRPGGRVVIGELGKWSAWAIERRLRGWLGHPVWRQARFRTAHELRHLADGSGFVVETLHGAIYYPPCGLAARLLEPIERLVGRLTTFGAAFLALAATKPATWRKL